MNLTVQYIDYPSGQARGWYVTDPDYQEVIDGPFASSRDAETRLRYLIKNDEGPDPMRGVDFPFAENH